MPVFQCWPGSEAQQWSGSLGCFQRKDNRVSGNARLHHIRPRKIFLICYIARLSLHLFSGLLPNFTWLLGTHTSHFTYFLPISSNPPTECFPKHYRDIDSCLYSWLSSQRATVVSPSSLIQRIDSRQAREREIEHVDASSTEELKMAAPHWEGRTLF